MTDLERQGAVLNKALLEHVVEENKRLAARMSALEEAAEQTCGVVNSLQREVNRLQGKPTRAPTPRSGLGIVE